MRAGVPRARRHPAGMPLIVDRSVAVMADFVCGANEAGFHCAASTSAATAASPIWSPTCATSSTATPRPTVAARSRSCAASSRPRVRAGTRYSKDMGRATSTRRARRSRSRWAATASASRASSRRRSSRTTTRADRLAGGDGAVRVAIAPVGYDRNEAVREVADRLHDELEAAGVRCCWTTAASARASCSRTSSWSASAPRDDRRAGLKDGKLEYQGRRDTAATPVPSRRSARSWAAGWRDTAIGQTGTGAAWAEAETLGGDGGAQSSRSRSLARRCRPTPAHRPKRRSRRRSPRYCRGRFPIAPCRRITRAATTSRRGSPRCRRGSPRAFRTPPSAATSSPPCLRGDTRRTRPQLVLGVIHHESGFKKYAVSVADAAATCR